MVKPPKEKQITNQQQEEQATQSGTISLTQLLSPLNNHSRDSGNIFSNSLSLLTEK